MYTKVSIHTWSTSILLICHSTFTNLYCVLRCSKYYCSLFPFLNLKSRRIATLSEKNIVSKWTIATCLNAKHSRVNVDLLTLFLWTVRSFLRSLSLYVCLCQRGTFLWMERAIKMKYMHGGAVCHIQNYMRLNCPLA